MLFFGIWKPWVAWEVIKTGCKEGKMEYDVILREGRTRELRGDMEGRKG